MLSYSDWNIGRGGEENCWRQSVVGGGCGAAVGLVGGKDDIKDGYRMMRSTDDVRNGYRMMRS